MSGGGGGGGWLWENPKRTPDYRVLPFSKAFLGKEVGALIKFKIIYQKISIWTIISINISKTCYSEYSI